MSEARGVYTLTAAHTDAVAALCSDADVASALGLGDPVTREGVVDWMTSQARARDEGRAYVFVLSTGRDIFGVCGLRNVGISLPASMFVAIGKGDRGKGHAAFAASRVLEVAFENLRLERVRADEQSSAPCRRLLAKLGFVPTAAGSELTRLQWQELKTRPALGALHPGLSAILAAELAAGNELAEMRTGWPHAESVFVRLRQPFLTRQSELPSGIRYAELNDPHWWMSEYTSDNPWHILASK